MSHPDVRAILIHEDHYSAMMHDIVEPYLSAHRQIRTLYRERNHPINCVRYTTDAPEAVIVVSHGFTESIVKFREMIYYFLQAHYVVYALDHCEHGKSYRLTDDLSKVHADSWTRWRDDLLYVTQFTRKAYPDLPLYLYAHSMGGGIGASAIAAQPDLFSKAVLTSPMIRPATAGIPWILSRMICALMCAVGKKEDYALGNHAFDDNLESFEESASVSEPRYEYYQDIRRNDRLYQTSGATWGWLQCAIDLNLFLQKTGWQQITCPILLFQADDETFVINQQQDLFISKISARCDARLIHMPETKHEIYHSHDGTMETYLDEIFSFLA